MVFPGIKELLEKYRNKDLPSDDNNRLWSFLSDTSNEASIKTMLMEELEKFEAEPDNQVDFSRIYSEIKGHIQAQPIEQSESNSLPKRNPFIRILKVAAILVIVFLSGGIFSYFTFQSNNLVEKEVIAYNEITAPLGARSEIMLPDGSKVWLNAGSTIRYMNIFNKDNRSISLKGEAYFKVAKNPQLPFLVKAGDLNIVALGTEFNVKSYDEEGIIETTLVEGKLSIRHNQNSRKKKDLIYLEPHQKAVYVKEDQQLSVEDLKAVKHNKPEVLQLKRGIMYVTEKVDPEPVISWRDNRLILKGEEISNLLIKLERKYDVKFIYESEKIKDFRFTGTLENETLTQVLDVIKLSAPIEYSLEGKTVKIFENEQMRKKFSTHLKKNKS